MLPKVVFVLPDLGGGGAQRVMLALARMVDRNAFDPHLVVIGPANEFVAELPPGMAVERLDARRLRSSLFPLAASLRRHKPAVIVSTLGYINLGLLGLRPLLGRDVRIIVREANVVSATLRAMPSWIPARALYARLYPRAAAIIAQTGEIAKQIAAVAPAAAAKTRILVNPVDEDAQRAKVLQIERAAGAGLRLVGAGRLTHQKGFDRLVGLMPGLPDDAVLTIYGEGPERTALQGQIDALGLGARVVLAGFNANLAAAVAGADVFVLPSRWEGLPNVVLEALVLGTSVVASTDSHVEDIASSATPGAVTVAPVDEAFAAAIMQHSPRTNALLRPSLLPDRYRSAVVARQFNALLKQVASA